MRIQNLFGLNMLLWRFTEKKNSYRGIYLFLVATTVLLLSRAEIVPPSNALRKTEHQEKQKQIHLDSEYPEYHAVSRRERKEKKIKNYVSSDRGYAIQQALSPPGRPRGLRKMQLLKKDPEHKALGYFAEYQLLHDEWQQDFLGKEVSKSKDPSPGILSFDDLVLLQPTSDLKSVKGGTPWKEIKSEDLRMDYYKPLSFYSPQKATANKAHEDVASKLLEPIESDILEKFASGASSLSRSMLPENKMFKDTLEKAGERVRNELKQRDGEDAFVNIITGLRCIPHPDTPYCIPSITSTSTHEPPTLLELRRHHNQKKNMGERIPAIPTGSRTRRSRNWRFISRKQPQQKFLQASVEDEGDGNPTSFVYSDGEDHLREIQRGAVLSTLKKVSKANEIKSQLHMLGSESGDLDSAWIRKQQRNLLGEDGKTPEKGMTKDEEDKRFYVYRNPSLEEPTNHTNSGDLKGSIQHEQSIEENMLLLLDKKKLLESSKENINDISSDRNGEKGNILGYFEKSDEVDPFLPTAIDAPTKEDSLFPIATFTPQELKYAAPRQNSDVYDQAHKYLKDLRKKERQEHIVERLVEMKGRTTYADELRKAHLDNSYTPKPSVYIPPLKVDLEKAMHRQKKIFQRRKELHRKINLKNESRKNLRRKKLADKRDKELESLSSKKLTNFEAFQANLKKEETFC